LRLVIVAASVARVARPAGTYGKARATVADETIRGVSSRGERGDAGNPRIPAPGPSRGRSTSARPAR